MGSPIAHSRSPALHRAAYAALGLPYRYDAIEVAAGELAGFVATLGPEWLGLSVTRPLKGEALDLATIADDRARRSGAANTLVPAGDGVWRALNTDVEGLVAVLGPLVVGMAGTAGPVVVLGGGATARAALVALDELTAGDDVTVVVRTVARAPSATALGLRAAPRVVAFDDPGVAALVGAARVAVNTTPPGAVDHVAVMLPSRVAGTYVDALYDAWPTPLARAWAARGARALSGLELLAAQAAGQVLAMTGLEVPRAVLRRACGLTDAP